MLEAVLVSLAIGGIPLLTILIAWSFARRSYADRGR